MLYDDQGVASLFKNGHELKDCEGSANFQVHKLAVQSAQDRGVVPADVENLEPLQVQIAVEGLGEHLIWCYQGVEGPGADGESGEEIEVHIMGWGMEGLKGELGAG